MAQSKPEEPEPTPFGPSDGGLVVNQRRPSLSTISDSGLPPEQPDVIRATARPRAIPLFTPSVCHLSPEGVSEWTAFLQDDSRGKSSFRPRDLDPLTPSTHTPLAPHQKHQKRQKHKKHKNRQKGRSEGTFSAPKATNLGLNRRFARHCQKVVTERSFCHRPSCIDGVPSKE